MNFLSPGAFLLGLLLPVIIALYLLKLRRNEQPVSSVYLWRRMVRDMEANAPWQRLRPNLLLILQLLFLLSLILAAARPFRWSEGLSGEAAILVIDASASMNAADTQPSRMEGAKARARRLVEDLPDSARVTIIEAGEEAAVRLASSRDRRQAALAIDRIQAGSGGSDMQVALELASAIAARQPGTQIIVLSDGRVDLPERLVVRGQVTYLPVGSGDQNQAVSLLKLEPRPAAAAAFVQVTNYGSQAANRSLVLLADGQTVNAFDLDLPAGGEKSLVVEDLPAGTRVIEARLEGSDLLAADDRAVAVAPRGGGVQVVLVTQGNLFLQTALELLLGADGASRLDVFTPEEYSAARAADLTIFDAVAPPEQLPASGSLLFIAPARSTPLFTVSGLAQNPAPRAVDPANPLLENITLAGVNVMDAVDIPLPEWAQPVVDGDFSGGSTPLLFAGQPDGRRAAVLAFDLHHSDLPLQPAFPLLLANLTGWLAPGLRGEIPTQVAPGENVSFALPAGVESVQVRRPDGSTAEVSAESGRAVYAETGQPGVYELSWGESGYAAFAVNLFSPQESQIKPADQLAGLESAGGQVGAGSLRGMREYWRPLALLALGLLTGEWLVYQRAGLARLLDYFRKPSTPARRVQK